MTYWAMFHPGGGFLLRRHKKRNELWVPTGPNQYGWWHPPPRDDFSHPKKWKGFYPVKIDEAQATLYMLEGKPLCRTG